MMAKKINISQLLIIGMITGVGSFAAQQLLGTVTKKSKNEV